VPEQVQQTFNAIEEDPTVYHVMSVVRSSASAMHSSHAGRNGPSEFHITGTLKNYDITSKVHKISIPTLLINGQYDEATDACMKPYFDLVPKVKWVTIPDASHMPQWEQRERFMEIVSGFLKME
jgi:pimeloyl-ACP methyl ester carboxylesterase